MPISFVSFLFIFLSFWRSRSFLGAFGRQFFLIPSNIICFLIAIITFAKRNASYQEFLSQIRMKVGYKGKASIVYTGRVCDGEEVVDLIGGPGSRWM